MFGETERDCSGKPSENVQGTERQWRFPCNLFAEIGTFNGLRRILALLVVVLSLSRCGLDVVNLTLPNVRILLSCTPTSVSKQHEPQR